jgi:alpha-L-arabinofuranosidase
MKKHIALTFVALLLAPPAALHAAEATLKVNVDQPDGKIPETFYGAFFEDINYSADGGLYAELIQNRSFEYDPALASPDISVGEINQHADAVMRTMGKLTPLYAWRETSGCEIVVCNEKPLNADNTHYLEIRSKPESQIAILNSGYDGIPVKQGKKYNFSFFARRDGQLDAPITISLVTPKGDVAGQATIKAVTKDWAKYEAVLEATRSLPDAQLRIETKGGDKVCLDMVSLMPQETFKGRANGLRPDLAQAIAGLKPKFFRFPGGCVVHGKSISNAYRWEDTVGPLEARKPKWNRWGYHQSYGLGYYEYFQFCEDVGAEPLPCLPMGVTPDAAKGVKKIVPMEQMQEWVDSALNLIEFANGPVDSKWGALRASMGHPAPFGLKYISIGNEEGLWPEVKERYVLFHKAIRAKYPDMKIIASLGPGSDNADWYRFADEAGADLGDEHYYRKPEWFFDNATRFDTYPKGKTKIFIGEYASLGNTLLNAVAEAAYLTGAERNGDFVEMTCYAPLLAKYNYTQWGADLIFFDNQRFVLTPNYHMLAMFGNNKGDVHLKSEIQAPGTERLYASSAIETKTGDLIIKLVNGGAEAVDLAVDVQGAQQLAKEGTLTTLSGGAGDSNTANEPEKIKPSISSIPVGPSFKWKVPAMSVQTLRIAGGEKPPLK